MNINKITLVNYFNQLNEPIVNCKKPRMGIHFLKIYYLREFLSKNLRKKKSLLKFYPNDQNFSYIFIRHALTRKKNNQIKKIIK
jgi:hypothetical protein